MNNLPITNRPYQFEKLGMWGEMGSASGVHVHYIQTVFNKAELNRVKIVSEIPESEKWAIRDLFQRNVDLDRIQNGIIPYLEDKNDLRFFNPLTLFLLPYESNTILRDIPILSHSEGTLGSGISDKFTLEGTFSLDLSRNDQNPYGLLQWNDNYCHLVAVDGQHRLTALKMLIQDNKLPDWKVPVQLVCIHLDGMSSSLTNPSLIDAVRRIFITINNSARRVSIARKILLNDILPLDIVSQEIIEYCRTNASSKLPLEFFDWRGDDESTLINVLHIVELNEILNKYFGFGNEEEVSGRNGRSLPGWLNSAGISRGFLSFEESDLFRGKIQEFVKGIHELISKIEPFRKYISEIERFERNNSSDIAYKYCFDFERFGTPTSYSPQNGLLGYQLYHSTFKTTVQQLKSNMPGLINNKIGLRAIFYSFNILKTQVEVFSNMTWSQFVIIYSELTNEMIEEGWFRNYEHLKQNQSSILRYLTYDGAGQIINYKIKDVERSLGAFVLYYISGKFLEKPTYYQNRDLIAVRESARDDIESTYLRELKKVIRAKVEPTFSGTRNQLLEEIVRQTNEVKIVAMENLVRLLP